MKRRCTPLGLCLRRVPCRCCVSTQVTPDPHTPVPMYCLSALCICGMINNTMQQERNIVMRLLQSKMEAEQQFHDD